MSDNEMKWISVSTSIFEDTKIQLIESMPEGDAIINCWLRLICMAGKNNDMGFVYLAQNIPYTEEMLATIWKKTLSVVRLALRTFKDMGMITIEDNGQILVKNYLKYQEPALKLAERREKQRLHMADVRANRALLDAPKEETNTLPNNTIQGEITVSSQKLSHKPITTIPQRSLNILQDSKIERKTIQWLEQNYPYIKSMCMVQTFVNGKELDKVLEALACIYEQYGSDLPITIEQMGRMAKSWQPKSENHKKTGLAGWIKGGMWLTTSSSVRREETHAEKLARVNREAEAAGI